MTEQRKINSLIYLRCSSDRQGTSLRSQLESLLAKANEHSVQVEASLADFDHMQQAGLSSYKSIHIDPAARDALLRAYDDLLGQSCSPE